MNNFDRPSMDNSDGNESSYPENMVAPNMPLHTIEIWQLDDSKEAVYARFLSYDRNMEVHGRIKPELYQKVWSGELQTENLEEIYSIFNIAHPSNYKARSLSVSDVVKVDNRFYYCDSIGFKEIPFERKPALEDRLKAAENNQDKQNIEPAFRKMDAPEQGR